MIVMGQDWRCILCGRVIGVYERLILLGERGERETSRATEPNLIVGRDRLYHAECLAHHEGVPRSRGPSATGADLADR